MALKSKNIKFYKSFCATFQLWMNSFLNNLPIYSTFVWKLSFSDEVFAKIWSTFFRFFLFWSMIRNEWILPPLPALRGNCKVRLMRPLAIGVDISCSVVVVSATLWLLCLMSRWRAAAARCGGDRGRKEWKRYFLTLKKMSEKTQKSKAKTNSKVVFSPVILRCKNLEKFYIFDWIRNLMI